jgi:hypothetical protein
MDDAAGRIVRVLYDCLARPPAGERCCAMVRFYETQHFAALDVQCRQFASRIAHGATLTPKTPCLRLLATAGDEPEWNDPAMSQGHRAVPLVSEAAVLRMPMVSRLCTQLGVATETLFRPDPACFAELSERTYDVFHVEHAAGSRHVPAQETFVHRYAIQSVLGFGGILPTGQLFAVLLFSKVRVPRSTADLFRPLALAVKLALLPRIFDPTGARAAGAQEEEVQTCSS